MVGSAESQFCLATGVYKQCLSIVWQDLERRGARNMFQRIQSLQVAASVLELKRNPQLNQPYLGKYLKRN